jgi:glycosyltransferase involved in cell wall biosynthesis
MRVLQVVPGISPAYGGPSVALTGLARALTDFGVDTTLLTTNASPGARLDVPLNEEVSQDGARYLFHNVISLGGRYGIAPSLPRTLARTIGTYDIVHIHWLFNFTCVATAFAAAWAKVPFVVQPNASLDPHLRRKNRLVKDVYLATVGRPLLTKAAALVFTSEQERQLARYGRRRSEWIVPVGLDARTFANTPKPGTFRAAFPAVSMPFILFLGRLSRQKGLDLLVEGFASIAREHPGLDLVIAGPDPDGYGSVIRSLVEQAGLSGRVHFPGMLSHQLKLAALVDAQFFALTSYAENFGAVITEALACGLPVLMSDRVNIHQDIVKGGAGISVECTGEGVAAGIRQMLAEPSQLAAMGQAGRKLVRDRYTWDVIVPDLVDRYKTVIRQARRPVSLPAPSVIERRKPSPQVATDTPLRILHVISSVSAEKGGPSKAAVELTRSLACRGHQVTLMTTDLPHETASDLDSVAARVAPATFRCFHASTPKSWGFSRALGAALRDEIARFDIVHIHSLYMFHTLAAAATCRRLGIPYIIRPHGTLDPFLERRGTFKKAIYRALVEKRNLDHAAAIHYTSKEEMRLAHGPLGIRSPAVVVPLGVDPAEFADLPDPSVFYRLFPETQGKRVVLFLSRLNFKKGLDVLVAAFAQLSDLRDTHLVIAGPEDAGYGDLVRRWVLERGLTERTTFTGMLRGRDKLAALAAASVFVLPSYTESFGFAVFEALAAGVPSVISEEVHFAHEMELAEAAVVSDCTPNNIASHVRRIFGDPELAARLRVNGPKFVTDRFTWNHVVEALIPVYRHAIDHAGATSEDHRHGHSGVHRHVPGLESTHDASRTGGRNR